MQSMQSQGSRIIIVQFRASPELHERLKALAHAQQRSISWIVRDLIHRALKGGNGNGNRKST